MPWQLTLHRAARKELEEQPVDIRARLDHIVTLIEAFGLNRVPAKYARHLRGPLWEFRLRGKDGIARALFVTAQGQHIIIVRVFTKKTQKTPRQEIEIALQRAKESQ